jgi:UDP-glucuronate 4-epimerase
MKVLVTGCAGFIGSHITELFLEQNYFVVGIDNFDAFYSKDQKLKNLSVAGQNKNFQFFEADISDKDTFTKLPADIDFVIHLAAKAGVRPSIDSPQDYIDTNVTGTLNILEWMRQSHVNKMIFGSSSSIYGNNKKVPFSESDAVDEPISPYAFTKKSAELLNYTYHHLYNISILNLRFFTVFGPRQRPDLAIRKFTDNILHNKPVHIFGDGSTARDYTFVKDICTGIFGAFNYVNINKNIYDTINIGNSSPVKLLHLVNTIYEVLDKKPDLVFEPMQPGDVDITYADISKAKKLLNYNPSTTLQDGISNFVEWYKESVK